MRKLILSVLTAVAVVCMVVLGVSLNAASILDNGKKEVKVLDVEAWYPLDPTSDPDYTDQKINGDPMTILDPIGDCQTTNLGDFCAIRLKFSGSSAPLLPHNINVQQAIDVYNATVVLDPSSIPFYAKKPL